MVSQADVFMISKPTRAELFERLLPRDVPTLWCPLLTHYDDHGAIDSSRIAAHLRHLSPHVNAFLIAGSTGDGWEMDNREISQSFDIAITEAQKLNLYLLLGALKTEAVATLSSIRETEGWIESRTGERDAVRALAKARVCGFTICGPRGKELSQEEIGQALRLVLEVGLPTAIYQLPQVTQNEMSVELVAALAKQYENFTLFKDTSGEDRVALSGQGLAGVVTLRGAEGNYARWLRGAGGPYHGFLLSTANCFACELRQIIADVSSGRLNDARHRSERLASVVSETFRLVSTVKVGNAFANANKAIDHFFAHGPRATKAQSPRLHAGSHLSAELIGAVGETLLRHGFMPAKGYLD